MKELSNEDFVPGKISVVIPCHQQGHFLPQALDSLLRQTYKHFEAIIINDGSTDNTREIALSYVAQHPEQIKYIEQECQGQGKARRKASLLARGEFWLTLDADDILEPQMLEECVRILQAEPDAAMVASNVWLVDESGKRILQNLKQNQLPSWPDVVIYNPFGGVAGILLRASAVKKVGGLAVEGRAGAEDWDLWIRLTRSHLKFIHLPKYLARYRQSSASHSRQPLEVLLSRLELIDTLRIVDSRLAQIPNCYPPISNEMAQALSNRAVFYCLGMAVASEASGDTLLQILNQISPSSIETQLPMKLGAKSFWTGVGYINLPQKRKSEFVTKSSWQVLEDCLTTYFHKDLGQTIISAIQSQYQNYYQPRRVYRVWLKKLKYALISFFLPTIRYGKQE